MRFPFATLFRPLLSLALLCSAAVCPLALRSAAAQGVINVPTDQTTIQAALNAASDGYTVNVAPGTYYENLNFNGKEVTLTSTAGPALTILDGSHGAGPAILLSIGTATHQGVYITAVNGFTIRNGGVESATAVPTGAIDDLVDATITNNIITGSHCAGVLVNFANTTIQGNEIDSTTASYGNCPLGGGSAILLTSTSTGCVNCVKNVNVTQNLIQNNLQGGVTNAGAGGLTNFALQATVQRNVFQNNVSARIGGALDFEDTYADSVINNIIVQNSAACDAGAIAFQGRSGQPLLFANNTISNNVVTNSCLYNTVATSSQVLLSPPFSYPQIAFINNIVSASTGTLPLISCSNVRADPAPNFIFDHNLTFAPTSTPYDASCSDPTGTFGNFAADPQLALQTYIPLPTSPAIDAGNSSVIAFEQAVPSSIDALHDLPGNPRLSDATNQGLDTIDLGAYERPGNNLPIPTYLTLQPSGSRTNQTLLFSATGGDTVDLVSTALCPAGGSIGPQGTITFTEDSASIGTAPLITYTAQATLKSVLLTPGVHFFAASYSGQSPCSAAVSIPIVYNVANYPATLAIASSVNPSTSAQPVTFTITLTTSSPNKSATIRLSDGRTALATLNLTNGSATYTASSLATGTHPILATSDGRAIHTIDASASLQQVVASAATSTLTGQITASPEPSFPGTPYNITLTLTPSTGGPGPTGSVQCYVGNPSVTGVINVVPNAAGAFSFTFADPTVYLPGTYTISCGYSGDTNYPLAAYTAPHTVVRYPTSTTLTPSTPLSIFYGQGADGHFSVQVQNGNYPANGTYTLFDNGVPAPICVALPINTSCPYGNPVLLDAGTHSFTIQYLGDTYNAPSLSNAVVYVIQPDLTAATLTSSLNPANLGAPVTFTSSVGGNVAVPTGSVTFFDGSTILGSSPLVNGSAQFSTSLLRAGTHTISVSYPGNLDFNPAAAGPLSQVVTSPSSALASVLTLRSNANPASPTQPLTFTASVAVPGPFAIEAAGTVTFRVDGVAVGAPVALDKFAIATTSVPNMSVGAHTVTAAYSGVVGTGGGVPRPLLPTSAPQAAAGSPTILPSSATLAQAINYPLVDGPIGFNLSITPVPVSIGVGRSANLIVTVTPVSGFKQTVLLSCTGLPVETTCTFFGPLIKAGGGANGLQVTTSAPADCSNTNSPYFLGQNAPHLPLRRYAPIAFAGLILLSVRWRRKPRKLLARASSLLLLLGGLLLACSSLSGCGHCTDLGTRPGNYSFTVTAVAQGGPVVETRTQTIQLTVTIP